MAQVSCGGAQHCSVRDENAYYIKGRPHALLESMSPLELVPAEHWSTSESAPLFCLSPHKPPREIAYNRSISTCAELNISFALDRKCPRILDPLEFSFCVWRLPKYILKILNKE